VNTVEHERASRHREIVGGAVLALAALLSVAGIIWDVQWHADVGPDTFFTVPHLLIYTGAAVMGITSLVVVLMVTARPGDARAVPVLSGRFAAPPGFLAAGTGSSVFLLYGLWDLWWHTVYGFDPVPDSPPHVGLTLAAAVSMLGAVAVFATLPPSRATRAGVAVTAALALAGALFLVTAVRGLLGTGAVPVAVAVLSASMLLLVAGTTRSPSAIALHGAVFGAVHAIGYALAPWAAWAYAGAVGLPVRDYVAASPVVPGLYPIAYVPAALLLALALIVGRRRGWSLRLTVVLAGLLAAAVLAAGFVLQRGGDAAYALVAAAVAALLGAALAHPVWLAAAALRPAPGVTS
jgi:hypothetical protein